MTTELNRIKTTWNELGSSDPLWAVLSDNTKRNGRWDEKAFFQTGEADVRHYVNLIQRHAGLQPPFPCVLDFGCGVGRLSRWWALQAERVYGVDISRTMIERAQQSNTMPGRIEYLVNERSDLRMFRDGLFDVVASHICLQHMPWTMAESYIREFARVCRSGGAVMFQLPTRKLRLDWGAKIRQRLVESLPFGWGQWYRRWRHGTATTFEFYCTPLTTVERLIDDIGMMRLHEEPDMAAGPGVESFVFVLKKP